MKTLGETILAAGMAATLFGATAATATSANPRPRHRGTYHHGFYRHDDRDGGAARGIGFVAGALTAGALASSYVNPYYGSGDYYTRSSGSGYVYGRPGYGYGGY